MDKAKKQTLLKEFQQKDGDTGSTEVQIALFSARISEITEHLREHGHDQHSRRGLFQLVGKRRRLLSYLHRENVEQYRALVQRLGLRR